MSMKLNILIDPADVEFVKQELLAASVQHSFPQTGKRHLSAKDLIDIALTFKDTDFGWVFLGYLLGRKLRFRIDQHGFHIEIINLPALWKAIKDFKAEQSKDDN